MEKQITFSGVNLTPYSDISPDGQLALCSGLERHSGSLRPVVLSGNEYILPQEYAGVRLLTVHNTADYNHFILYDDSSGTLYWSLQQENLVLKSFGTSTDIVSASTVGNTLVIINSSGIHYYLYQPSAEDSGTYEDLGELPEISLNFGLKVKTVRKSIPTLTMDSIGVGNLLEDFTENNQRVITDQVMGKVNEMIAEAKAEGRFIYPFFVRYAYRMFDGSSFTYHSAPILMLCSTLNNPLAVIYSFTHDESHGEGEFAPIISANVVVFGVSSALDYLCTSSQQDIERLQKWSDVIQSVSVFISSPVTTTVSDGLCTSFAQISTVKDSYCVGKHDSTQALSEYYQLWNIYDLYKNNVKPAEEAEYVVKLPVKEKEDVIEEISNTSNFYLLTDIKLSDLSTERKDIVVESDYLDNLVFKEKMSDDYLTHDKIVPKFSYIYNQRLNVANLKRMVFSGFNTESLFCYQNAADINDVVLCEKLECYVYVKEQGKEIIVKNSTNLKYSSFANYSTHQPGYYIYFFYPNPNAYKARIRSENYDLELILDLKPHPLLNGAYYFTGFEPKQSSNVATNIPVTPDSERFVNMPNKIYTSEVGNPYYFPLSGINTVGVGQILGMAAVTTPLSQGQFGQFPLMVFCSDGNYAMQVNSEGLYSGISAMPRDVCTNPESIMPIDAAIVFVSSRGVMTADGIQINSISQVLEGVQDNMALFNIENDYGVAPVDFFQTALPAYDYAGRRIIFFSKGSDYAWILSLEDATWSQAMMGRIYSVLNVYPYSYIQFAEGNSIVRLNKPYSFTAGEAVSGLFLSRPFKLDTLALKSIHQIAVEGTFSLPQRLRLFGSHDNREWFLLGESLSRRVLMRGRQFKYFRVALYTLLREDENISGLRIDYELRPERRFR